MPTTFNPITGIGDQFEFATTASPTVFTVLNGVDSIANSGQKVSTLKNTTMATTNGVDTFNTGTQTSGSLDVKGLFFPAEASQTALIAIMNSGAAVPMKVTYGTSNSQTFTGIFESFTTSFPLDKNATFDCKIVISGPITYA